MSYEHPSVYITTYSNIDVYECLVDDSPIMRRCKDDWVNATQILKLCNFPKAKRTKILEKGVQQGQHEKVQGGYGRFQGTWIPLPSAQNLAKEYGLPDDRLPVLYIDVDDPAVVIPKKLKPGATNKDGTPVKRKYGKRPKKEDTPKKMKFDDNLPPSSVFTHDYPQSMNRNDPSMAPMGHNNMHMMPVAMNSSQIQMPHMPPTFPQQPFAANGMPANAAYNRQSFQTFPAPPDNNYSSQQMGDSFNKNYSMDDSSRSIAYRNRKGVSSQSTNETNWSQEEAVRDSDTSMSSTELKKGKEDDQSHAAQLLRFFSEDSAPIPFFLYNPPADFNINEAIDDEGHSTLHWAASIGKLNLVQLVLYRGANPLVFSNYGLNALSKCISFNNCYDLKNFQQILDALETCLINTDINGRTPLHYLAQFSKVKSKLPALSYYVNVIFNKLRVMSNNNKGSGVDLLKNVIDHQDVNGDTCLHLASRAGCTYLVKFFLSNGARDDLLNVNNEIAKSIIMQQDLVVYNFDHMDSHSLQTPHTQDQFGFPQISQHDLQDHHQLQHRDMEDDSMPQFTITDMAEDKDSYKRTPVTHSLGTPIRASTRKVETPDTQRTTVQEEEVEELHDRVSKEHLKSLLDKQAGTVEDNKENIFVDDLSKATHEAMSTPKTISNNSIKSTVLGAERKDDPFSKKLASPVIDLTPHPPQLDKGGSLVVAQPNKDGVKLPMQDVASMMHGMINSLSTSYEQELNGLSLEYERIKKNLAEKRQQDRMCSERAKKLLEKSGFENPEKLEDATVEVRQEMANFEQVLKHKENQLSCSIEKLQAFELANAVQEHESQITEIEQESSDPQELWALSIELSKVQVQRNELVRQITQGVKHFALSSKMNKYRKLISLSCGLRVEDIDGIIDGIQESLSEGTM